MIPFASICSFNSSRLALAPPTAIAAATGLVLSKVFITPLKPLVTLISGLPSILSLGILQLFKYTTHVSDARSPIFFSIFSTLKPGLLVGTRRGFFKITERVKQVLTNNPAKIDDNYLTQFPEFLEFQKGKRKEGKQESKENETITQQNSTPSELLESSYKIIREEIGIQLLSQVKKCTMNFLKG